MPERDILKEASDPETPPEVLEDLARPLLEERSNLHLTAQGRELGEAIAKNPNTPVKVLFHAALLRRFSSEVLANPIFPLLSLEDPALLEGASTDAISALALSPSAPDFVLFAAARRRTEWVRAIA